MYIILFTSPRVLSRELLFEIERLDLQLSGMQVETTESLTLLSFSSLPFYISLFPHFSF